MDGGGNWDREVKRESPGEGGRHTHSSFPSSISVIFSGCSVHNGVLITPGATPLTRMPRRGSKGPRLRMNPFMACLEAMYMGVFRLGCITVSLSSC